MEDCDGPVCLHEIAWTVKEEIAFFQSAEDCSPKGRDKRTHMANICDNFYTLTGQWVAPEVFWKHLRTMFSLEALDDAEEVYNFSEEEDFVLPEQEWDLTSLIAERSREKTPEDKLPTPKVFKDYSRKKEPVKKEKDDNDILMSGKTGSSEESDEDDTPLKPKKEVKETKKSKSQDKEKIESKPKEKVVVKKEEKIKKEDKKKDENTPKRTTRNTKEKPEKDQSSAVSTPVSKKAEDTPTSKKVKVKLGKRSLRSRDEDVVSPTPTPQPSKRARRI